MYNVAVTHDNHIIAHSTDNLNHLRDEHPGASVRQFTERPLGLRPGNYLNSDGIVERPRDDHVVAHESIHWEEAVEWAVREKGNAVTALLLEPRDRTKLVAKVFGGLIYNVLLAASNPANRHDLPRWRRLKGSMVSWQEFGKRVSWSEAVVHARPPRQSSSISVDLSFLTNDNMEDIYDERYVYLYNAYTENIELARSPDIENPESDVPLSADDENHFIVRNVLGYIQNALSSDGTILSMGLVDTNNAKVADLSPLFSTSNIEYTSTTDRDHVYVIVSTRYKYTVISGLPFTKLSSSVSWRARVDLDVGDNVVNVLSASQDGTDEKRFIITITRTDG